MKQRARKVGQRIGLAALWAYTIIIGLLDWQGRAGLFEDPGHQLNILEKGLNWLFSTPPYVVSVLAIGATVVLFWPNIRDFFKDESLANQRLDDPTASDVERIHAQTELAKQHRLQDKQDFARQSQGLMPDLNAVEAFNVILERSKRAQELAAEPEQLSPGWYEKGMERVEWVRARVRNALDREVHDLLSLGLIKAWGRNRGDNPWTAIKPEEWNDIQLRFDERTLGSTPPNACAFRRKNTSGSSIAYVLVHFSRDEFYSRFPLNESNVIAAHVDFAQINFRDEHRSEKDDYRVVAIISAQKHRNGVAVIGRYAQSVHTIVGAHWEWRPTRVIRATSDMFPHEVWEVPIFVRQADGENILKIFDVSHPLQGDRLILLDVKVIAGDEFVRARVAYHVRNLNGGRLTLPIKLADIPYVTGADDA